MEWVALIVFTSLLLIGLGVMSVARMAHTNQMVRLVQHQRRISGESPIDSSVFITTRGPTNPKLAKMLVRAGLDSEFNRVRMQWTATTVITGVLGGCIAAYESMGFVLVFVLMATGLVVGACGYLVYLKVVGDERQKKLTRQLPQVLESMSSTLKAGSSIMDTFRAISETAPEPIRDEFYIARGQVKLNKSLIEVIREMSERITTVDFKFFVQAITISEQTGGDLAEVVAGIAETLRDRFRLQDMVNSITAQGKMTAAIVGVLPYLLTGALYLISPTNIQMFLENNIARLVICVMILWECLGICILWKIVSYEV